MSLRSNPPLLSLILVTHDSARWIGPFFESWKQTMQGAPGLSAAGVELFIADSGSADDSAANAAALRPEAQVLACGNVGYGAAANRGARRATAPWLLVCNPDITFSTGFAQSFLQPLLEARVKPWSHAACLAPRLLNPDGSVQPSVGRFPTVRSLIRDQFRARASRKSCFPQPESVRSVDWANGACLLLRRDVFLSVGGFDENYFLYVEEVDLQRRLRTRSGQVRIAEAATWFIPEAAVTHHQPNAAREPRLEVQRYAARGMLRYFAKHASGALAGSLLAYRLLALVSGRLSPGEAFASRKHILQRPTGP